MTFTEAIKRLWTRCHIGFPFFFLTSKKTRRGREIVVTTEASGYLYKMVRRLVGGLYAVGIGKMTPEALIAYREARVCDACVSTAPARGLFMEKVFLLSRENQGKQVIQTFLRTGLSELSRSLFF